MVEQLTSIQDNPFKSVFQVLGQFLHYRMLLLKLEDVC